MSISALFLLLAFVYLARLVASSWGERGSRGAIDPGHTAELVRLREEVDQLQAQVTRLTDEQSFLMRLLDQGGRPAAALPGAAEAGDNPNPENP
jgi:cell division protein FtsB